MIIILYVFQQEITLLIMNDFLLCGKRVHEGFIDFEKGPFYINSPLLNLCGKKQISFGCESNHIRMKGSVLTDKLCSYTIQFVLTDNCISVHILSHCKTGNMTPGDVHKPVDIML